MRHPLRLAACAALFLLGAAMAASGAQLTDLFADRQSVTSDTGFLLGTNSAATLETNEPRHGNKPGGHSLWLSWIASEDGILTVSTTNSTFDTTLGVYTLDAGTNSPMLRLREAARNDDDGTNKTSLVQFGVTAGTQYEIAVDGYQGATGVVALSWDLQGKSKPPPIILSVPADRALQQGDPLSLSVNYQASGSVKLKWYFNDNEITNDSDSATLVIPNFQATNTGLYKLRFTANGIRFYTEPIEVQINSEGATNALARNKLFDATNSPLKPEDGGSSLVGGAAKGAAPPPSAGGSGVVRGYNGTQIFSTLFAYSDPAEPVHCGVPGGASYWFAYEAPANGTLALNTDGSSFNTILAVYTYNPPLLDYSGLIPVACDNNSGANGLTSSLQFSAVTNRTYLVVVDGVNAARGTVYLNYLLTPAPPPNNTPAGITQPPQPRTIAAGSAVTFQVVPNGAAPLAFLWRKDGTPLTNETAASLTISNAQPAHAGAYSVVVTNSYGAATSSVATLTVVLPPAITKQPSGTNLPAGASVAFDLAAEGTGPLHFSWSRDGVLITNLDAPLLSIPAVQLADAGIYTVAVLNSAGLALSSNAPLSVLGRLSAGVNGASNSLDVAFPAAGPAELVVEFTDQLDPPAWTNWPGPLVTNNGVITISADTLTNVVSRFFRVRFQ